FLKERISFRPREELPEDIFYRVKPAPNKIIAAPGGVHETAKMEGFFPGQFKLWISQVNVTATIEGAYACYQDALELRGQYVSAMTHRVDDHVSLVKMI